MIKKGIVKELISGIGWATIGRGSFFLAYLAVLALLARILPPEQLGGFFLIYSFVTIGAFFARMGSAVNGCRLISEAIAASEYHKVRGIIQTSLLVAGSGGVFFALIILSPIGEWIAEHVFYSQRLTSVLFPVAVWVFIHSYRGIVTESFRGFGDIRFASLFNGPLEAVISIVFLAALVVIGIHTDLRIALFILAGASAINVIVGLLALRQKISPFPKGARPSWSRFIAVSLPIMLSNLLTTIILRVDLWITGMLMPGSEVALFGSAQRLATLMTNLTGLSAAVLPPFIVKLNQDPKKERLQTTCQAMAAVTSVPALMVTLCFLLAGNLILRLVYGEYYVQAAPILAALALGQATRVMAGSAPLLLVMTGHQNTLMTASAIYSVVHVGAIYLATSHYGLSGAAISSGLSTAVQSGILILLVRKKVGIWSHAFFSARILRKSLDLLKSRGKGLNSPSSA